jgi:hypothetical protein
MDAKTWTWREIGSTVILVVVTVIVASILYGIIAGWWF